MQSETTTSDITVGELKVLLEKLAKAPDRISIRFHLKDGSLPSLYYEVLVFTSHALVLAHIPSRTILHVAQLTDVVAFEFERAFSGYEPQHRYGVKPEQAHPHRRYSLLNYLNHD